jgi:hypothetical protein
MKRLVILLGSILLCSSLSHAAVTINFVESGGDVVATSSGSINTAGFAIKSGLGGSSSGFVNGTNVSASWLCIIGTGAFSGSTDAYVLSSFTSDNTEVCATQSRGASSGSGDFVGVISRLGSGSGTDGVYVPLGYVSGNPVSGTSTWSAATFASLGLITGTQVFTWGSGADADSLTLNIGGSVAPTTYSVGGDVSGLTGTGLQLQNNGADTLPVATDGPFTFVTELADNATYAVTVSAQPTGQTCSVTNGSGAIAATNVTNVAVTCVTNVIPTYSVGGMVSGLTGAGLVLQNNGGDALAIAADDQFAFATELTDGAAYAVTVSTQPTGQTCSVTNGSGTIATADVTNVAVACVNNIVPPVETAIPVPTLSQWALILFSVLLGLMVFVNRRRLF